MELTDDLTRDVETVMSETGMMMPPVFVNVATSTHSIGELMASEPISVDETYNSQSNEVFDPSGDVELVDAPGPKVGRKRKRGPSRARSQSKTTKKRRTGIASRTRSRSKRGHSQEAHVDYVCSVCGAAEKPKKRKMRSRKAK